MLITVWFQEIIFLQSSSFVFTQIYPYSCFPSNFYFLACVAFMIFRSVGNFGRHVIRGAFNKFPDNFFFLYRHLKLS